MSLGVLFVHRAFPAQLGRLALELTRRHGWRCHFLVEHLSHCPPPSAEMLEALDVRVWPRPAGGPDADTPWPQLHGAALERARAVFEAVRARPELRPDLVVGHGGLVPTLLLREALRVLDDPGGHQALGEGAAAVVRERYARDVTLPRLAAWLAQVAGGRA